MLVRMDGREGVYEEVKFKEKINNLKQEVMQIPGSRHALAVHLKACFMGVRPCVNWGIPISA